MLKVHYSWSVQLQITQVAVLQNDFKKASDCKKEEGCALHVPPPPPKSASKMEATIHSFSVGQQFRNFWKNS